LKLTISQSVKQYSILITSDRYKTFSILSFSLISSHQEHLV